MAWMIKAGIDKMGQGAGAAVLSIASTNQAGAGSWRFSSTHCHSPSRHPQVAPTARPVWQDVLAQLTTEL